MPEKQFKPFWKTCEFIATILFIVPAMFLHLHHPRIVVALVTMSACIYATSRALFKQNRAPLIHDSHKTSELYVCLGASLFVGFMLYRGEIDLRLGMACLAGLSFTLVMARGYTKSHTAVRATVVSV